MISIKIKICFIVMLLIEMSNAHGRLIEPIARSSAWRKYRAIKPYYDDNSMNCGGLGVQTITSRGKCSICGESYTTRKQFTKGRIVKSYTEGQLIKAVVEITANHNGFFEFSVCNVENTRKDQDATQQCLDRNKLATLNNSTRMEIRKEFNGKIKVILRLPRKFTCKHCVFQWKYTAKNSWNTDPITGEKCVGCGVQEQFYGCSDIRILPKLNTDIDTTTTTTTTTFMTSIVTTTAPIQTMQYNTTSSMFYPTTYFKLCPSGDGFYAWSTCSSFYRCDKDQIFYFDCPAGTLFNTNYNICDWPYNVKCEFDADYKLN